MQRFATHGTANKPHRTTTHTWFGDSLPQANMLNTCAMPCGHLQHTSQRSLRKGGDRRDRRRWIHYEDVVGGRWRKRATPGSIGVPTTYRCGKPTQPSMEVQNNGPRNNRTRASSKNNLNTHECWQTTAEALHIRSDECIRPGSPAHLCLPTTHAITFRTKHEITTNKNEF